MIELQQTQLNKIYKYSEMPKSNNRAHGYCRSKATLPNGEHTRFNRLEGSLHRELRERNITFKEYCREMNPIIGEYVNL